MELIDLRMTWTFILYLIKYYIQFEVVDLEILSLYKYVCVNVLN